MSIRTSGFSHPFSNSNQDNQLAIVGNATSKPIKLNRPYSASTSFVRTRRSIASHGNEGLGLRRSSFRDEMSKNHIQIKNDTKYQTHTIDEIQKNSNQLLRITSMLDNQSPKNLSSPVQKLNDIKIGFSPPIVKNIGFNITNDAVHFQKNENNQNNQNSRVIEWSNTKSNNVVLPIRKNTVYREVNDASALNTRDNLTHRSRTSFETNTSLQKAINVQKLQRPVTAGFNSRPILSRNQINPQISQISQISKESSFQVSTSSNTSDLQETFSSQNIFINTNNITTFPSVTSDGSQLSDSSLELIHNNDSNILTPTSNYNIRSKSTLPKSISNLNSDLNRIYSAAPSSLSNSSRITPISVKSEKENVIQSTAADVGSKASSSQSQSTESSGNSYQSSRSKSFLQSKNIGNNLSDFSIIEEIGSGGCGTVYKVKSNIDQNIYVAKKINVRHLTQKQLKETLSEVYIMKDIQHDHIIKFYSSFVENQSLYIIMEHAESGDLHQYYRQQRQKKRFIKESFLWKVMLQTCLALQYLHSIKHIIHRDVKPLNLFLSGSLQIKLGDLGMSRIVDEEEMLQTNVGTPAFLSPEQIKRRPYDFKVDVWGLGCVMYSLAALKPPFKGDNILELSRSIVQDEATPIPKHYTPKLRSLILSMLSKSAFSRPSISEILSSIPEHIRQEYEDKNGIRIRILGDDETKDSIPKAFSNASNENESSQDGSTGNESDNKTSYSNFTSNSRSITLPENNINVVRVKQPKSTDILFNETHRKKKIQKKQEWKS